MDGSRLGFAVLQYLLVQAWQALRLHLENPWSTGRRTSSRPFAVSLHKELTA